MTQKAIVNKFSCLYEKENDNSNGFGLVDDLLGRYRKRVQQGSGLNPTPPSGNIVFMVAKEDATKYATKKGTTTVYIIAKT